MADVDAIADRIMDARQRVAQITPITDGDPAFDVAAAYRVADAIRRRRIADGERVVGWKLGFTNRTIWDEYGVHAPIFGPMYHATVHEAPYNESAPGSLHGLVEPRIEPEIVFRMVRPPEPGMDGAALFDCVDGVALGFEVVNSIYPGWRFRAADTIAAFALHGRLYHGPFAVMEGPAERQEWLPRLGEFEVELRRGDTVTDRGKAANVLDGPLNALAHFVRDLDQTYGERLRAGDIVTTAR
jgi:2-oxo-3-hexenedioate decarboxylase